MARRCCPCFKKWARRRRRCVPRAYPHGSLVEALDEAIGAGAKARDWVLEHGADNRDLAGSASYNFLMLFGYLTGGWLLAKSALLAKAMLDGGEGDPEFLNAKMTTARFYCEHLLPRTQACLASVLAGSESVMGLTVDQL